MERLIPADRNQKVFSRGAVHDFAAWFLRDAVFRIFVTAAYTGLLYQVLDKYFYYMKVEVAANWNTFGKVLLAILVADFLRWVSHYLRHKVKVLWVFHRVHHSQPEVNIFTEFRSHFLLKLVTVPIEIVPMYMMGLNIETAIALAVLLNIHPKVQHGNIKTNFGPLRYILVTPQSHRIHHSSDPRHADKNFGALFTIWDHLFGTQWTDYNEYPVTGIADKGFPIEARINGLRIFTNYWKQLVYPFRVLARAFVGRGWEIDASGNDQQMRAEQAEAVARDSTS